MTFTKKCNTCYSSYSVAICTYNGQKFLADQLESILKQSELPDQIVLCDDNSSDDTNKIVETFIEKYSNVRWKHIINKENIGYTKNFEQAIIASDQEIVFLSDQDDVWLENKAEIILEYFSKNPYSIVFTDAAIVDENLKDLGLTMFGRINFNSVDQRMFYNNNYGMYLILSKYLATGATMAFKKAVVEKYLPVPPNPFFIHDAWIATIGICAEQVGFITDPLIKYRQHSKQAIGAKVNNGGIHVEQVNEDKTRMLLEMLRIKWEREYIIYSFFKNNEYLISPQNLKLLERRKVLYENMLRKSNTFWHKLSNVSYSLYKYKIPEFNTLRLFCGNLFGYLFMGKNSSV